MDNSYEEENLFKAKKFIPMPPALPGPSTIAMAHPLGSLLVPRNCGSSPALKEPWDRLFDEAYRADVEIHTESGAIIYGHASILGLASPVFRSMFKISRSKHRFSIPVRGVPPEAVRIFIQFLYSSCYEEAQMEEHALSLLLLSHAFAVPQLKQECEYHIEHKLLNMDNIVDIFQLAVLCDAPRLRIICQNFILKNFKAASSSAGWKVMRESNPAFEKELVESLRNEDRRRRRYMKKLKERKIYVQLFEAMEALVHICRDGCRTIGPHDKVLKEDQEPCKYEACKALESLVRHFAVCKLRVPGGCLHCKRMWQLLELHSRLCANSDACRVPLCRNFKQRIMKKNKKKKRRNSKEEMKWKILVRKILRSKSITGAPYFTLAMA